MLEKEQGLTGCTGISLPSQSFAKIEIIGNVSFRWVNSNFTPILTFPHQGGRDFCHLQGNVTEIIGREGIV